MTASLAGPEPDGERTSSVQDDGPAMRQVGPSHKPLSSGIAPQATDIGVPDWPTVSHHTALVRPRVACSRLAAPSRPSWPSSVVRCQTRKRIGNERKKNVMSH